MEITLPGPGGTQALDGRWAKGSVQSYFKIVADFGAGEVSGTAESIVYKLRDFKTLRSWQVRFFDIDFGGGDTVKVVFFGKGEETRWCGQFAILPLCTATNFDPGCRWSIIKGTGAYDDLHGGGTYDLDLGAWTGSGFFR